LPYRRRTFYSVYTYSGSPSLWTAKTTKQNYQPSTAYMKIWVMCGPHRQRDSWSTGVSCDIHRSHNSIRPGPPASGSRQGHCSHAMTPHPMERGQPRWGRLPDLSGTPDVVTVHLNRLTHALQHASASLSHAQHDSAASASGLPSSSGGGGERSHHLYRNLRY